MVGLLYRPTITIAVDRGHQITPQQRHQLPFSSDQGTFQVTNETIVSKKSMHFLISNRVKGSNFEQRTAFPNTDEDWRSSMPSDDQI